jgi:tetratricopeptide (TPR) repeat protein/anti-sigma regulatory factor (Ser/Thr protein kinase)
MQILILSKKSNKLAYICYLKFNQDILKKIYVLFFMLVFMTNLFAQNKSIDSLKKVLKTVKIDTARVNSYNALADLYKNIDPDSTLFFSQKAMVLATKTKYDFGIANAYINKGNANVIMSNYKVALNHFRDAKSKFKVLIDNDSEIKIDKIKSGLARSYNNSGIVYAEMNEYTKALENYQKALKVYQEMGVKKNISIAYNNIGSIYRSLNENKKALTYFLKSLKIQEEIKEPTIAITLTNIGLIYFEEEKNAEALYYYSRAEKGFDEISNKHGFILLLKNLGDYYKKQKDTNKAIGFYNKSLKISTEIGNQLETSICLQKIGQLSLDKKQYNDAINFAEKSLKIAEEVGSLEQIIITKKLLSEIYEKTNNPEKSLEYYKSYIIGHDSLYNDENKRNIVRAEINFEFEKKEALLKETTKRNQQLAFFAIIGAVLVFSLLFLIYNRFQIKRRLTLQNEIIAYEQKALHLQMNPHFIFNCLGSISSFIVQNGTDSAIKYLSKFSKLMRLTLEYSKGSLIPVDKEIESLQNYLDLEQLRFNKKFEFSITASDLIEDDMALPPLLIQPFVENAILHGMVPKIGTGKIEVSFNIVNNQLVCVVTDDGIGFKKSKALKQNDIKTHKSMALEITKKRLQMIGKKANVIMDEITNSSQDIVGTKVILSLPLQYTSETKIRI